MISPRERYEKEVFWELADDISMTDIQNGQDKRSVFQKFFRIKQKTD